MNKDKRVVAVFAADTHIIENTWASRPSIRDDSFYALEQVVSIAIKHRAPLILAGDTLELQRPNTPTSRTIEFVATQIDRLEQNQVTAGFISGQHCMATPHWLQAVNPWMKALDQQRVELGPFSAYCLNFRQDVDELMTLIKSYPDRVDGLVLHQQWKDLGTTEGNSGGSSEFYLSKIESAATWILTGDLHENRTKRIAGRTVVSPGATYKRTTREPDAHYAMALLADGSWARIPLKSRPVHRVVVESIPTFEESLYELKDELIRISQAAVEKGIWPTVAVPLVLIEDVIGCNAIASAKEVIQDTAHLLQLVSVKAVSEAGPVGVLPVEVKDKIEIEDGLLAPLVASAVSTMDSLPQQIINAWMNGKTIKSIREEFLADDDNHAN